MNATDDPVSSMLAQVTQTLTSAGQQTSDATAHAQQVLQQLQAVSQKVDHYASFLLLPLCLALLILHEHYRSVTEGGSFRLTQVLGRTVAVVAAVLGYSQLCGLICQVAGAGSGWMTNTNYLDLYDTGANSLTTAWDRLGGLSDMPKFIGMVIVWVVLMMSVLFAYIAGALLSVIQAVSLSIFLGLGKACIVVSLVPGVSLAKSWARSLAQVAAWSTVGGVIGGLLSTQNISIGQLIVAGQFVELLKASAHFVILALATLSVPLITAKLFSGGAAGLTEVLPGFLAARGIATGLANRLQGSPGQGAGAAGYGARAASPQAGGASPRVHKVPFERAQRHSEAQGGDRPGRARTFVQRVPIVRPPHNQGAGAASSASQQANGAAPQQERAVASQQEPADAPQPERAVAPQQERAVAPATQRSRSERDTLVDRHIEITGDTA